MVVNPKLPPVPGYVEVERNGERFYKKIETPTKRLLEEVATQNQLLAAKVQAQTDRSDFIEDCMAELAIQAYQ